jgi:hypothetical protein
LQTVVVAGRGLGKSGVKIGKGETGMTIPQTAGAAFPRRGYDTLRPQPHVQSK